MRWAITAFVLLSALAAEAAPRAAEQVSGLLAALELALRAALPRARANALLRS